MTTSTLLTARTEFASALNQICTERGITPESVLETIKTAILAAYRKDFGLDEEKEYEVEIDNSTGSAKIFEVEEESKGKTDEKKATPAPGGAGQALKKLKKTETTEKKDLKSQRSQKVQRLSVARKDITPPGFGRIAAQTAKQVILQKIREAEKTAILDEYKDKIGQLVNGMILRFDNKDIICDIGRGQGRMSPQEQVNSEDYQLNKRLTLYIADIRETLKGKQIIVSRTANELVTKLFKREVPEVNSGAVEIKIIAREPGRRSKVAVASTQAGVDPVGSCVGQKGVRVQAVIDELGGEKIDVIQYNDDPIRFIAAALSPAQNLKIEVKEKARKAIVITPEDQLSLAIGKEGQNVRLAAQLTGYKIDIKGAGVKPTRPVKPKISKTEQKKSNTKAQKKQKTLKKTIKTKSKNTKKKSDGKKATLRS